jgi:hypothetical protein
MYDQSTSNHMISLFSAHQTVEESGGGNEDSEENLQRNRDRRRRLDDRQHTRTVVLLR